MPKIPQEKNSSRFQQLLVKKGDGNSTMNWKALHFHRLHSRAVSNRSLSSQHGQIEAKHVNQDLKQYRIVCPERIF